MYAEIANQGKKMATWPQSRHRKLHKLLVVQSSNIIKLYLSRLARAGYVPRLMEKTTNNQNKRLNALRGTVIIKAGFASSIHALDPVIKEKIDQRLKAKCSPEQILRYLAESYPEVKISRSALYNYRKRNFEKSQVSSQSVSIMDEKLDMEKVRVKSTTLLNIKRFIAVDIPLLREKFYKSMGKDGNSDFMSKETRETARLYMDAIKIGLDTIPKLNININLQSEPESENKGEITTKTMEEIVQKYGKLLTLGPHDEQKNALN